MLTCPAKGKGSREGERESLYGGHEGFMEAGQKYAPDRSKVALCGGWSSYTQWAGIREP